MTERELLELARRTGALLEGHFRLSSGRHSPVYFQCARLLERPETARRLGAALAARLPAGLEADLVIGPALGGILVAHEVARALSVRALFAERDASGRLALRRGFAVAPGERAVVVEDVVTTGGSLRETMELVVALGGRPVAAAALVDRSGGRFAAAIAPLPFASLARLDAPTYAAEECPLCREGSPAVKPGSRPESTPPAR